ncbi:MAG: AI-2E family transporter [Undibacterium sp.]|nr:AI-2E family transporter [Opitutaceae bacterium]
MSEPTVPLGTRQIPADNGEPTVVRFELSLRSMLIVLAVIAGVWSLLNTLPALLVLVVALVLVGALHPVVGWLEHRQVRRTFALCVVFGFGTLLALGLLALTVPAVFGQMRTLAEREPEIRESIARYLDQSRFTANLAEELRQVRYAELLRSSTTTLLTASALVFRIVAYSFAAVFLAFYLMLDRDRLRGALFAVVPRAHHIRLSRVLLNLGTIVGGYIRGQLLTCALMGGFIFVLLLVCGVPNALALAIFGGAMDLLPYIGIFLTMGPVVLAATAQGPVITTIVFLLMLAYGQLENRVLIPLVYGRALRLPSSVVFFSLLLGTTLAGILGALLALPIAAAVLMLVEELRIELPGESVQPKDVEQRRQDHHAEREYERRAESMPAAQAAAIAVEISGERKKAESEAEKAPADPNPKNSPSTPAA